MHRPVRRRVGDIHKERFIRAVLTNEFDGVVADGVGVIKVITIRRYLCIVTSQRARIVEAAGAVNSSEEAVEPALARPVVLRAIRPAVSGHVPLAGHVRTVTGLFEHLGDGYTAVVQVAAITVITSVIHHVSDACLVLVEPGHQRSPRRAAAGGVVELRKAQAAGGKSIHVGRVNFTTIAADVRISHIVSHNQNNVRPFVLSAE
ncbi:hypothetical protein ES703_67619 [subsurface metagenome]